MAGVRQVLRYRYRLPSAFCSEQKPHHRIDHQPEGAKLIFLALPIPLPQFAALPMAHTTRIPRVVLGA